MSEPLDYQHIVLWVLSIGMAGIGWWCRQIWDAVAKLREDHSALKEDIPKTYMPAARMDMIFNKLDSKLDRISDKLDTKADK